MDMVPIIVLITVSMAQRTSINSCTNEKSIFKLDIRQRVQNLSPTSTVRDLNASALCLEAYMYDYIWLQQLWTPGQYNYKNVSGKPQKTNDYRELQSIKEYTMDPSLGTQSDLYLLQTNIRTNCPHMKFLGEFSFYISEDSYLMQNSTRFLRRPGSLNKNIYDIRYDNDNFAWAVNDQMKTIPYAVPWNYFDPIVMNDMKDIIYRVIIDQHKLDGIVFLQPSLGLYSVINQFFQAEIQFYGIKQYLQDFYQSLGLKQNSQTLFFMGGEDNSNTKIILQNYLQQIYGSPLSQVWADFNYTLVPQGNNAFGVDAKTVKGNSTGNQGQANSQGPPSSPTCWMYQIITGGNIKAGIYNTINYRYTLVQNGSLRYNGEPFLDDSYCYNYQEKDIIEIQYDPSIEQFIFKKYSIDYTNFQQLSMMIPGGYNKIYSLVNVEQPSQIQIKFPFQFSQANKNSVLVIQALQQIAITTSPNQGKYYYAQIWPSINQNENNVTLNFKVTSLNLGLTVGVCNQDIVTKNNNQKAASGALGTGVYQWQKDGYFWHHSNSTLNNAGNGKQFTLGDILSVTYTKSNSSIQFYKNSTYQLTLPIYDKVKNLNFCCGLEASLTVVDLVY